jgi:hypothetical protein
MSNPNPLFGSHLMVLPQDVQGDCRHKTQTDTFSEALQRGPVGFGPAKTEVAVGSDHSILW